MSALGVAVGVAAITGVLGVSSTIEEGLLSRLSGLRDVLTVEAVSIGAPTSQVFPERVIAMTGRIPTVVAVVGTRTLSVSIRRTDLIPADRGGAITVRVFDGDLYGSVSPKPPVNPPLRPTSALPEVLLGSEAAQRLGIDQTQLPFRVRIGDRWLVAVGILRPAPVAPGVDSSVFIPAAYAREKLGFDGNIDTLYVRTTRDQSDGVRGVLPATISPQGQTNVAISRASDAIVAEAAARTAFEGLFLVLASVGLLVAGFGVGDTLMVAVVERRGEIGIRRALGATRASVAGQFMVEGVLVAVLGSTLGVVVGFWITLIAAWYQGLPVVVPILAPAIGTATAVGVGVLAAAYPAVRAAMLPPSDALRTMA